MFDLDLWREIFQSINKNRTRSLLSGFTVAFAIMLFAFLFGMANGLNNTFTEGFVDDANNSIFLQTGKTSKAYKGQQAGRRIRFKNEDYDYLKAEFKDGIEFITGKINRNVIASYRSEQNNYPLKGVHPDHQFLEKSIINQGRYVNQSDIKDKTKIVVIGRLVKEDLFIKENPIGKYINLRGIQYKVVGVFSDAGGDNEERIIYMPITTAQRIYGNNSYIDQISLTYNPSFSVDQAIDFGNKIQKKLKQRFTISPKDRRGLFVRNFANSSKGIDQMNGILSFVIILIGFGTLVAGIVGVSNIMIFIVKERTKEIGIRKALGASPKSIIRIILLESIFVTIISGYLGLIAGTGILRLIGSSLEKYFIKDPSVSTSLVIGATITLIIAGSIAGYFPAKRASRIKPIVALRDE